MEAAQGLAALACFPPGGGGGAAALPGSHGRGHGGTCQQCGAGLAGHKRFYQVTASFHPAQRRCSAELPPFLPLPTARRVAPALPC